MMRLKLYINNKRDLVYTVVKGWEDLMGGVFVSAGSGKEIKEVVVKSLI